MPTNIQQALNAPQWEAVSYCDGPSLVIAGAGSGKTRVLTYKIAYLIQQGLPPFAILALTFTNKAAREMNARIATVVGEESARQVWSGTFHSIFARILRREAQHIGFTPDFTIYDTADAKSLVKAIVRERGLDDKTYKPQNLLGRISEAKNALILPAQYKADAKIRERDRIDAIPETGAIYETYVARCRAANAMDFDDLLLNTFLLFQHRPDVLQRYKSHFAYILVDEYQDTNAAQHRIIAQLTDPGSRICVVGDDAQSIYAFRGANIGNILRFQEQYPTARLIKLEQNYRSTQTIVDAANSLIRHNVSQIPKKVFSTNEKGERIKLFTASSDKDESYKVVGEIRRLHRQNDVDFNDIALLYRTNAQSRSFEDAFRQADIPYRIYGGLSFYQRKEIKDVIAYLRLICNTADEEAFKRIINYPARGIGSTTLGKLQQAAVEHGATLWDVAANPAAFALSLNKGTTTKLQGFLSLIDSFRAKVADINGYDLTIDVVRRTGIGAEILSDTSTEGLSRKENLEELLDAIKAGEAEVREETGSIVVPIQTYLSQVSLLTDADQEEDGEPRVTLMTIHAAKGLEFSAVFITGMEQELFPNANALFSPKDMEEERRLFYVALTRAKRYCYLTYAKTRYRYGNMEFADPSQFIDEIDEKYIEEEPDYFGKSAQAWPSQVKRQNEQRPLWSGAESSARPYRTDRQGHRDDFASGADFGFSSPGTPQRQPSARDTLPPTGRFQRIGTSPKRTEQSPAVTNGQGSSGAGGFSVGDRVSHTRFGTGSILALEGSGDNTKALIAFDSVGNKNLLLRFARLQKI